jgi:hypothetical protein
MAQYIGLSCPMILARPRSGNTCGGAMDMISTADLPADERFGFVRESRERSQRAESPRASTHRLPKGQTRRFLHDLAGVHSPSAW